MESYYKIKERLHRAADEIDNNSREARVMDMIADSFDHGTNQFTIHQQVDEDEFDRRYKQLVEVLADEPNSIKMYNGGYMDDAYDEYAEKIDNMVDGSSLVRSKVKVRTNEIKNPWIDFLSEVRKDPEVFGIDPSKNILKQASKLYREMNGMKPKVKKSKNANMKYKDFIKHISKNKAKYGINKNKNFIRQASKLWEDYKGGIIIVDNIEEPKEKRIPVVKQKGGAQNVAEVHQNITKQRRKLNKRNKETNDEKMDTVKEFGDIIADMAEEESYDAHMIADSMAKKNKKRKPKSELRKQLKIVTKHIK